MDPVAFSIFGIDIMWYGIIISIGVVVGTVIAYIQSKRVGFKFDNVIDLLIIAIPVSIICARAYFVIFDWGNSGESLKEAINIRNGGLAIHGGLIGGVLTAIIYCKVKKVNFWKLADVIAPGIAIGQSIGRWGNYVNKEAYGSPTTLPWGIFVDGMKVHPTFLYESVWSLLVFIGLMILSRTRKVRDGEIFLGYAFFYSLGRLFIESLRTDSLMLGEVRVAQLVSVLVMITALLIIIGKRKLSKENKIN